MSTYSRTFAHVRRQKAADYRRRQRQAHLMIVVLWALTHRRDGTR